MQNELGWLLLGLVLGSAAQWIYGRLTRRRGTSKAAASAAMLPIQALLDSIDDLAWIKDTESRFILVNRKFGEVFGVAPSALIGKTDFDLSAPEIATVYREDDIKVMQSREPSRQEEQIARSLTEVGWSETIKVPVFDVAGKVIGTAGVARDVTERRRARDLLEIRVEERTQELSDMVRRLKTAQSELITKEKMAALGAMVAGIAHELNTPIGTSLTVASTLHDHTEAFRAQMATGLTRTALDRYVESAREGIDILARSLHKASELVSSFKQVAVDQSSTQRRKFMLDQSVSEIVLLMGPALRRSTHSIECRIPKEIELDSFPGPLGQVLTNLINNALIHAFESQPNGRITISAQSDGAAHVKLSVSDDGQGIPEEHMQHIFDPFFTTKLGRGGSGLGLSIVYNLVVEILQGEIHVDSMAQRGTAFTLILPLQVASKD
jgi:PAS domain S-box-containing protein